MKIDLSFLDRLDLDNAIHYALRQYEQHPAGKTTDRLIERLRDIRTRINADDVPTEIGNVYEEAREMQDHLKAKPNHYVSNPLYPAPMAGCSAFKRL